MAEPLVDQKQMIQIMTRMWSPAVKDDLYAWVMYAFPWGVKGTPLENRTGPYSWQKAELDKISAHIKHNKELMAIGLPPTVYNLAVASGRGVGKSSFVAWVTLWFMSVVLGGTTILSANNDTQLSSKTFAEIGKWKTLCLSGHWFDLLQKKLIPHTWFADEVKKHKFIDPKLYYAEGVLWNEDNPDSFAGAHNTNGMLLIFDEASGIPAPVWKVSEGFFTDISAYRFWLVFSNPRRNSGAFYECFHKFKPYWSTRNIDARSVDSAEIDKAKLNEIVEKYGAESDEARIEVLGEFPHQGENQFISKSIVQNAVSRETDRHDEGAALVMGVDPARFGSDSTVIRFRQGRNARLIPPISMRRADNMQVANKVAELIDKHNPDGVFIDGGAGAGIIDRLKEMKYQVHEVGFGTASSESQYYDHRTELWAKMRDWLEGASIDGSDKLVQDLCAPQYSYEGRESKLKLESKEDMKERGEASPDHADAIAVTFHKRVARRDMHASRLRRKTRIAKGLDYKIFGGS